MNLSIDYFVNPKYLNLYHSAKIFLELIPSLKKCKKIPFKGVSGIKLAQLQYVYI